MKELTNTPERQSSERMDSDPDADDIRPDRGRHRSRRRRWYLLAVISVILLTLVVIHNASLPMHGCTLVGIHPEPDSGVSFRLAPVLANAAMPVHVRACVPSSRASITVRNWSVGLLKGRGFGSDWYLEGSGMVRVKDPSLTLEPITVQLTMADRVGTSMFDSSAVVQPHMFAPNGPPPCTPVTYDARVTATQIGRLVAQP
jgi:hypothetical protein